MGGMGGDTNNAECFAGQACVVDFLQEGEGVFSAALTVCCRVCGQVPVQLLFHTVMQQTRMLSMAPQ